MRRSCSRKEPCFVGASSLRRVSFSAPLRDFIMLIRVLFSTTIAAMLLYYTMSVKWGTLQAVNCELISRTSIKDPRHPPRGCRDKAFLSLVNLFFSYRDNRLSVIYHPQISIQSLIRVRRGQTESLRQIFCGYLEHFICCRVINCCYSVCLSGYYALKHIPDISRISEVSVLLRHHSADFLFHHHFCLIS